MHHAKSAVNMRASYTRVSGAIANVPLTRQPLYKTPSEDLEKQSYKHPCLPHKQEQNNRDSTAPRNRT